MKHSSIIVLSAPDTASANGIQIDASELFKASFQANFGDSTAAGTLVVQGSNDILSTSYLPSTFTVTHWTNITGLTATITAGASVIIPAFDVSYRWLRVVFTSSVAGTTTITVNMYALAL